MDVLSRTFAVLALVCAIAVGTLGSTTSSAGAAAAAGDCTPGSDWGTTRDDSRSQTVSLVNSHRTSIGLKPLAVASALQASAVWKARHMAKYGYMGHNDPAPPVARGTGERMAACGVTGSWGENIAAGFATPLASSTRGSTHRGTVPTSRMRATPRSARARRRAPRARSTGPTRSRAAAADPRLRLLRHPCPRRLHRSRPLRRRRIPSRPRRGRPRNRAPARFTARAEGHLRRQPAQLPRPDAHPAAAGRRPRAGQQGGRAEARDTPEDRQRLLQRTVPGTPAEGADAPPPRRIGRVRLAEPGRARGQMVSATIVVQQGRLRAYAPFRARIS